MFCTRCGSPLPEGALFCPNCGNRLGGPAPPMGCGADSVAVNVFVNFPSEGARVGGTFGYFAVKVDGRDIAGSYKRGERACLRLMSGPHEVEVRQVNDTVFSSGIAKTSVRMDIRGGEVLDVVSEGKTLSIRCNGQAAGDPVSSSSSTFM